MSVCVTVHMLLWVCVWKQVFTFIKCVTVHFGQRGLCLQMLVCLCVFGLSEMYVYLCGICVFPAYITFGGCKSKRSIFCLGQSYTAVFFFFFLKLYCVLWCILAATTGTSDNQRNAIWISKHILNILFRMGKLN